MSNPNFNIWCNALAQNCISGCCDFWGDCATRQINCDFEYDDFSSNSGYFFPDDPTPETIAATSALGAIIGGIVAGVIVLVIVIALIIWCKKRIAAAQAAIHEVGEATTVIFGNQPVQQPAQAYQGQTSYQGQSYPMQPYGQGIHGNQPNQFPPGQYPVQQGHVIIKT